MPTCVQRMAEGWFPNKKWGIVIDSKEGRWMLGTQKQQLSTLSVFGWVREVEKLEIGNLICLLSYPRPSKNGESVKRDIIVVDLPKLGKRTNIEEKVSISSSLWVWDDYGSHNKNAEHKGKADVGNKISAV